MNMENPSSESDAKSLLDSKTKATDTRDVLADKLIGYLDAIGVEVKVVERRNSGYKPELVTQFMSDIPMLMGSLAARMRAPLMKIGGEDVSQLAGARLKRLDKRPSKR